MAELVSVPPLPQPHPHHSCPDSVPATVDNLLVVLPLSGFLHILALACTALYSLWYWFLNHPICDMVPQQDDVGFLPELASTDWLAIPRLSLF